MVTLSLFIANSKIEGPGGLFDINATLPLVVIQFLLLMFSLNFVFYNPLLQIMNERKEYILNNLAKASQLLDQTSRLTIEYEQKLLEIRKKSKSEIINSQKIHKEILESELDETQNSINNLLKRITVDFLNKRKKTLLNLNTIIQVLGNKIEEKLSF